MIRLSAFVVAALFVQTPVPAGEWISFEGAWSATGERHTLPTEGHREAAVVRISGSVVLTGNSGLGRGFRGEAIGYDDGHAASVGRWVWTDDRGDRIYGELKGEPIATSRRTVGTVTGGTGRYAGLTGEYELTWQYVIADGVTVQGRTTALKGRFRRAGTP